MCGLRAANEEHERCRWSIGLPEIRKEQSTSDDETAANEHQRVVEEIVREIFDALDTSEAAAEGDLSPEELACDLGQVSNIGEGFCVAMEDIGPVALTVLSDCRQRVREVHRRAKLKHFVPLKFHRP